MNISVDLCRCIPLLQTKDQKTPLGSLSESMRLLQQFKMKLWDIKASSFGYKYIQIAYI